MFQLTIFFIKCRLQVIDITVLLSLNSSSLLDLDFAKWGVYVLHLRW